MRGRPVKSQVRQQLVEILYFLKSCTGYDLHKIHNLLFDPVSQRLIYYHLHKGLDTKEFVVQRALDESGEYSWGPTTHKTYYSLGTFAKPKRDERIERLVLDFKKSRSGVSSDSD